MKTINNNYFSFLCRLPPGRPDSRRDRGRDGQGEEVPAADHGRIPHQDQRDPHQEGGQPAPANARVLSGPVQVSLTTRSISPFPTKHFAISEPEETVDQQILLYSETSIDRFYGSNVAKCLIR